MTNRERVIAAITFQTPDKTPYNISLTGQMRQKMEAAYPDYKTRFRNHTLSVDLDKPQVEVRPGYDKDEYGVIWNKTGADKDIGVIDQILLKETEDLATFAFPPVDEVYLRGKLEQLSTADPQQFRIANIGFSLFERAWTLRGMENLLCDMLLDPDFVNELLDRITARLLCILDIALEYNFDGFYFGDDWGQQKGLIMGPAMWRTFIKPRLKQLYDKVHAAGRFVIQHSCGDIREIMDDLYEIGLNVYQTFQPEIYGYDYAKHIYGKICIWGGVSTQRDLPVLSPDGVRAVTKDLLAAFPHGGLIAGPTHSVPSDVPPENLMAMLSVLDPETAL